jgi:hydrogenase maturation factor HypF (carbamoyltransferase family)
VKVTKEKSAMLRLFLIPCSCGVSFTVAEDFDRKGTHIRSFIPCSNCGKRHDPKNRLLQLGYRREGYWGVDDC